MSKEKSKEDKSTRTRAWTFILYPESAPDNWKDILNDMHIEWVLSPLHDKDLNANGELKKAHYHIMLSFGNVKSFEQIREITELLNCPIPQKVHNMRAMVRYMVHLDNPDKVQYDVSSIDAYGGFDLSEMLKANSSERYELIREMIAYIRDNDVMEFFDILNYAEMYRFDDWFPLLCDNSAFVIDRYIKSNRHRLRKNFNMETGEIYD